MVDIFDEVEEDLRAERAQKLLLRYGGYIVALCVVIVAAGAGWQVWRWWQARQDRAAASEYIAAISTAQAANPTPADKERALAAFDALSAGAPEGYRTLARLHAAALKANGGDLAGASALWNQVAADGGADPLLRDLATLLWAQRDLDKGDPALIEARLKPLAEPGNAWRSLAQEQLALLDLRQGRAAAAKAKLQKLAEDVTAPQGVRGRASAMLGQLGG